MIPQGVVKIMDKGEKAMRSKVKKIGTVIVSFLIVAVLVTAVITQLMIAPSGNERYFSGAAERYCSNLISAGFPRDYAVALTELHLLHPTWDFTPLLITEQNSTYTWSYVIEQETADGELNVIYSTQKYAAYHHPTNKELYDSGYYQASVETVEYFMDPRNFLNELDIFQFYTLSGSEKATLEQVQAVLAGTFMEEGVLENGVSYAEYFMTLGKEFDINPIFLAAKVRQEQGTRGTSPIISGVCGTKLVDFYVNQTEKTDSGSEIRPPKAGTVSEADLLAYNGYYNHFNIGATGTGVFQIYQNAMKRAKTGTAAMAEEWGDGGAWNTRWKALYGGAYFLKKNYIERYQSTVYLQKFDVDGRASSNFSHQYMTSVFGAMGEARSLYQSLATVDALDAPASFLIPVYAGMPETECKDPSNGSCSVTAQATTKFDYQSELTAPQRQSASNEPLYLTVEAYPNATIKLGGVVTHTNRVEGLEYAWNGGAWQTASDSKNLNVSLFVDAPESSSHILVIRGKSCYDTTGSSPQTVNSYFLFAVIYVQVTPPPNVKLSFEVGNTLTERTLYAGNETTLPPCDAPDFAGWYGSDGSFLPAGSTIKPEADLSFSAIFLDWKIADGAAISTRGNSPTLRFSLFLRKNEYLLLSERAWISLGATVVTESGRKELDTVSTKTLMSSSGKEWVRADAETPRLSSLELEHNYSAEFYAILHYTDGTQKKLSSPLSPTRTAKQVAAAALADSTAGYSEEEAAFLQSVIK